MGSRQRPRPRAKQSSDNVVPVSPTESGGRTLKSTISPSPLAPPPAAGAGPGRDNGDDGDDDDDFFKRTRRVGRGAPTSSGRIGQGMTEEVVWGESEEEEVGEAGSSNSSNEGRQRKRVRRKMSSWTKTASFSKREMSRQSSRQPSAIVDDGGEMGAAVPKGRASRSSSLTPPPPLEKEALLRLSMVLEQHNPIRERGDEEADDEYRDMLSPNAQVPLDLDPDLARMIKGSRAFEIRKQVKEREAKRLQQEELTRRAARAQQKSQKSQTIPEEVIEVEDSDEDGEGMANARNRSSSPVEFVSASFSPAKGKERASREQEREAWVEPFEEEVERIDIVMKGGEGGTLQSLVKVKPTTKIKKLLDHYIEMHGASIPKARLRSVRIRFDGDAIDSNMTVGEVGIEDGEQMDVVW